MTAHSTDHIGIAATAIASTVLAWFGIAEPSQETLRWFIYSGAVGTGALLVFTIGDHSGWCDRALTTFRSVVMGALLGSAVLMYLPDPGENATGAMVMVMVAAVYVSVPLWRSVRNGTAIRLLSSLRHGHLPPPLTPDNHPGRRASDSDEEKK